MEERYITYSCLIAIAVGCMLLYALADSYPKATAAPSGIKKASINGEVVDVTATNSSTTLTIAHDSHTKVQIFERVSDPPKKGAHVSVKGEWLKEGERMSAERLSILKIKNNAERR